MHDRKHNRNVDEARARTQDAAPPPHDRRHGRGDDPAGQLPEDHVGERDPSLPARSLSARGEAPDGSEDGAAAADAESADGRV